jgi:hypothetical protein
MFDERNVTKGSSGKGGLRIEGGQKEPHSCRRRKPSVERENAKLAA